MKIRRLGTVIAFALMTSMIPGVAVASAISGDRSGSLGDGGVKREPQAEGFWLNSSGPGGDFSDKVEQNAEARPSEVVKVRAVLSTMLDRASSGEPVELGRDGMSRTSVVGELEEALEAIDDIAVTDAPGGSMSSARFDIPSSYQIRGNVLAGTDQRTYTFDTEFEAQFCGGNGCEVEDRILTTWILDPGRTGSRVQFNSRYFPRSGAYNDIFARAGIYINGSEADVKVVGGGGDRDGTGSGRVTLNHTSTAGDKVVMLIEAQADFLPEAKTYYDKARTTQANCYKTKSYCRFNVNRNP